MQAQTPFLAISSTEDHVSYLASAGHTHRRKAEESALQAQQEVENSPRKVDSQRNDEEQKLRKVMQHERDHYDLSKPESPRKRPRPLQTLTPPASPPNGIKSILKNSSIPDDLPDDSPLKKIMIQRTASAKLNYLLKRIMELQKDEKIIVFSDYAPIMWYLGEALELLGIEHLIYIQRLVFILNLS
jgi:hypothetical protein